MVGLFNSVTGSQIEAERLEAERLEAERKKQEAEHEQEEAEYEQQTDLPTPQELYDYFNFVRTEYGKFKAHKGVDADRSVSKEVAMKALQLENSSFTRTELNSQYRRMVNNYLLIIELEYKAFNLMNAAYDKLYDSAI